MLAVRPMLIVPRRVFVRKCLKPRKVKVAGLITGRTVPCNRLPSKRNTAVFSSATWSPKAASRSSTSRRNRSASSRVLERRHEVVGVPGELRPSSAALLEAPFKPQVQDVVQVHVRQHG